ncbi:LytR/AlgR family response regulator transcription factor [Paenibacillus sp. PL91]|uniref:LytR/AlgR family response regulator transcription factor n=1 Tax=Paenibacillus sp. PL91 TaxID=2729538 RepID=UPI00145DF311|nr:LytTR family DNA-binding domain-containing protein [Paenibacillus sp. PL91]MBC9203725.1 response regulator transcription factor [Paenibacillus sp. PL91]
MKRNLSVIIAEDQEDSRALLEYYARHLDLKIVSSIGSGDWLVEDCIQYEPDLLFLDIGLHGIDGIAAYKKVLENGFSPYLIIVSGTQDLNQVLEGMAMNCVDFVPKPISLERISAAVEKARMMIEKDMVYTNAPTSNVIQLKSNYRTTFITENNLLYVTKIKGGHRTIVNVDGGKEGGIETTNSITDIQSQCSEYIFAPNQSSLVNLKFIKSVYASDNFFGTYVIQMMTTNNIEFHLTRRKRKEFEVLYSKYQSEIR